MSDTIIHIDEQTEKMIKLIADEENRDYDSILSEAIKEYLKGYQETRELLNHESYSELIRRGKYEVENNVKGIGLDELED